MFRQLTQGVHLIPRNWARFWCSNWAKWDLGCNDGRTCANAVSSQEVPQGVFQAKVPQEHSPLGGTKQKSWNWWSNKNNVFTLCNLGFSPTNNSRNHPNSSHIVQDPDLNFDSIHGSQHPLRSHCHFDTSARIVAGQLTRPQDPNLNQGHTVDGRNPAPVDRVNLSLCTRGYTTL